MEDGELIEEDTPTLPDVDSAKLRAFESGIRVQHKASKEKQEALERRRRREEAAARRVVGQVAHEHRAQPQPQQQQGSTFVRAGTLLPSAGLGLGKSSSSSSSSSTRTKVTYKLPGQVDLPTTPTTPSSPAELSSLASMFTKPTTTTTTTTLRPRNPKKAPKRKRKMDEFLAELKRKQHRKVEREAAPTDADVLARVSTGARRRKEPLTTNLFVGNLDPSVTEHVLRDAFSVFGALTSIKIIWPRTPEQHARGFNTGFVRLAERPAAERALRDMHGSTLAGRVIRLNWSSDTASSKTAAAASAASSSAPPEQRIVVRFPQYLERMKLIDFVAANVAQRGPHFEHAAASGQWFPPGHTGAPLSFIFDPNDPDHCYYRWRVFSLTHGGTLTHWPVQPFRMNTPGPLWVPPTPPSAPPPPPPPPPSSTSPEFSRLLHELSLERQSICRCMVYAIDHAEEAKDICEQIVGSLLHPSTSLAAKVARLFLISDILYNSGNVSMQGVTRYRLLLEAQLPSIFDSLHASFASLASRMASATAREKIVAVLRAWEAWSLFPEPYIRQLEHKFLGNNAPLVDEELDGTPLLASHLQ